MTNEELTNRLFEQDERITRHTEQIKTLFNSVSDLRAMAESVHSLAVSVSTMARDQQALKEAVDGLGADMEEIKTRPARRWGEIVTTALSVAVTAIVTWLLAKAGVF